MAVRNDDDVKDNVYVIQSGFTTLAWKTKQTTGSSQFKYWEVHSGFTTVTWKTKHWEWLHDTGTENKTNNRKMVHTSHAERYRVVSRRWHGKQTTGKWFTLHTLRGTEWFHDTSMENKTNNRKHDTSLNPRIFECHMQTR